LGDLHPVSHAEQLLSALWRPWHAALCNLPHQLIGTSDQAINDQRYGILHDLTVLHQASLG